MLIRCLGLSHQSELQKPGRNPIYESLSADEVEGISWSSLSNCADARASSLFSRGMGGTTYMTAILSHTETGLPLFCSQRPSIILHAVVKYAASITCPQEGK